jgi:hypothetical protein
LRSNPNGANDYRRLAALGHEPIEVRATCGPGSEVSTSRDAPDALIAATIF